MNSPIARATVVLVDFPYTDFSESKTRPAVVISRSERDDGDVLLAFIGTYRGQPIDDNCVLLSEADKEFSASGLKRDSLVRCDKVMTLDCQDCIGKLGVLASEIMAQVDDKLRFALGLDAIA